jgi:hypothetical protein
MTTILLLAAGVAAGDAPAPTGFAGHIPDIPWYATQTDRWQRDRAEQLAIYCEKSYALIAIGLAQPTDYFNLLQVQRDFEDSVERLTRGSTAGVIERHRQHMALIAGLHRCVEAGVRDGRFSPQMLNQIRAQHEYLRKHFAAIFRRMA